MRKIPPWLWVTGIAVGVWYLSKPKTTSGIAATGASPAGSGVAGGLDAGRPRHGHHHIHGAHRGFVGHSVDIVDYGRPFMIECDPRYPCARQPILPCRCG